MGPTEFGRRMEKAREARRWSRAQLADVAGIPRVAGVHEIENGTVKEPRHARALAIAKALGVTVEWLYGAGSARVPDPLAEPVRTRRPSRRKTEAPASSAESTEAA